MVRHLASSSFDDFQAALMHTMPEGAVLEGVTFKGDKEAEAKAVDAGALLVRCMRKKCVKAVERLTAKVVQAQEESDGFWPSTASIGDVLRASICCRESAGMRKAIEALLQSDRFKVIRIKNKFRTAASEIDVDTDMKIDDMELEEADAAGRHATFPDLHVNVVFQARGASPIVAEIQIHDEEIRQIANQSHRLYEIIRADSMSDVVKNDGVGMVTAIKVDDLEVVERLSSLEADHAQLKRKQEQAEKELLELTKVADPMRTDPALQSHRSRSLASVVPTS
jgi:hypothetical protein